MTMGAVILFSGLWALWYTPELTYEPRRNEQIASIELVLEPNASTMKVFDVNRKVEELGVSIRAQTIMKNDPNQTSYPTDIPAIFSAKILDSQRKAIASFDNVTSLVYAERIAVEAGVFQIELTNASSENALSMQIQVHDVTKVVNHPFEAMGQWLTIITLPIIGLGIWFVITKFRQSNFGQ